MRAIPTLPCIQNAKLFTDSFERVREVVAGNVNVPMYKEYVLLFTDPSLEVREAVAGNPNAPLPKK